MQYQLTNRERTTINQLISIHGGAAKISYQIKESQKFENRIARLKETNWYSKIKEIEKITESYSLSFTKEDANSDFGEATFQVSGLHGTEALYQFIKENERNGLTQKFPAEFTSVVGLTEHSLKSDDLLATLVIAENILHVKRFCSTCLVTTPIKKSKSKILEKIEYSTIKNNIVSNFINQGTLFGNFSRIEVANKNYLLYLNNVIETAIETGATVFLSPSWNTVIAGCYLGQQIPEVKFKVSCFLGTQNVIQFRLLINIIKQFLLPDGTSPIVEINLGSDVSINTAKECFSILNEDKLYFIDLITQISINNDLGQKKHNWLNNAEKLLKDGFNLTLKYESAESENNLEYIPNHLVDDTLEFENSEQLGKILYQKTKIANDDARILTKQSIKTIFAGNL
jgi:hypothetical protein